MACIYVLKSEISGKIYTGSSKNDSPSKRIKAHNSGKNRSTKSGGPWELVYKETYYSYTKARTRELFLKTGRGREILKNILAERRGG
jgi:putative endonuclease